MKFSNDDDDFELVTENTINEVNKKRNEEIEKYIIETDANIGKYLEAPIKSISNGFSVKDFSKYSSSDLQHKLLSALNYMPVDEKIRANVAKNISECTSHKELIKAALVMDTIFQVGFEHADEILKGAHIMIHDGGFIYDSFVKDKLAASRISSHHKANKGGDDVSMQAGEIFRELLLGKTKDNKTWFQLEAHGLGGVANFVGHGADFLQYRATGKNVGQYGLSKHVDTNYIEVKPISRDKSRVDFILNKKNIYHANDQKLAQQMLDNKYKPDHSLIQQSEYSFIDESTIAQSKSTPNASENNKNTSSHFSSIDLSVIDDSYIENMKNAPKKTESPKRDTSSRKGSNDIIQHESRVFMGEMISQDIINKMKRSISLEANKGSEENKNPIKQQHQKQKAAQLSF